MLTQAILDGFRSKQEKVEAFHDVNAGSPTPLVDITGAVAARMNVGRVLMKDEGRRMGLKAFKALGVGFALSEEITRRAEILSTQTYLNITSLKRIHDLILIIIVHVSKDIIGYTNTCYTSAQERERKGVLCERRSVPDHYRHHDGRQPRVRITFFLEEMSMTSREFMSRKKYSLQL